jgi:N-methylhydantoinase B
MTEIRVTQAGKPLALPHKSKGEGIELAAGDIVQLLTPGGGGYGDPSKREAERIARDLRRGYMSKERAAADYGSQKLAMVDGQTKGEE